MHITAAFEVTKCYSVNSQNYCFYTSGYVLNWDDARQFCAERNSVLPIITNQDIDEVFQRFIASDSYSGIHSIVVWIGAHANDSDEWHWIKGRQAGLLDFSRKNPTSHAATVVPECFKDHNGSQYNSGKFDSAPSKTPESIFTCICMSD